MRHEILYRPDFALMKTIFKAPGETVTAETGSLISMSPGLKVDTSLRGGLLESLGRKMLGGETLFQNRYTSTAEGQELLLAPAVEGDIFSFRLREGESFYLQSGAYLAHVGEGLSLDTKWAGVRGFFGGMGFFLLRVRGPGEVFFGSYGAIHEVEVGPQGFVVDTGHVAGFTSGLDYSVQKFAGYKGLFFSGEGFVARFTGSGKIYLQSRNSESLASFFEGYRREVNGTG